MTKKISLTEILATRVIWVLAACIYYWMCTRTDWKPEYMKFQNTVATLFLMFTVLHLYRTGKYKKDFRDEFAENNLRRCDAIILKFMYIAIVVIAFIGGMYSRFDAITGVMMGWMLMGTLVAATAARAAIFFIMDTKGV